MNLKKKILSAVLAGGIIFSGGNALTNAAEDGLTAFKEAYLATPVDNRNFKVNIDSSTRTYKLEINGDSFFLRDATMKSSGKMTWEFTNPSDNQISTEEIPFYVEQNGDDMTMYVRRSGRWSKFMLPAMPVGIANAIKTTEISVLQQNIAAVKSVEILKDDANQRIMNVTLDGKKVSELLRQYSDKKIETLSQEDKTAQKSFIDHLADALKNTDVVCAWTVNKTDWRTVTVSADFTNLIHAYGKDYLDDAAKGEIILSQTDRSFYEVLGYYADLHFVANYYKPDEALALPSGANSAVENANIFDDLIQKIASTKR